MQFMCKSQFTELWINSSDSNANEKDAQNVFEFVYACYSEDHRHYHNAIHIDHCLRMLNDAKASLSNPYAVELAVWFHDVIYNPTSKENEAQSAHYFDKSSSSVLSSELRGKVRQLILKTTHDSVPETLEEEVLMDIDLSSFGLDWQHFHADGINIRKEQSHLSDQEFYSQQVKFQKSLLDRDRFFYSEYFFNRFEEKARENVTRYFELLCSQGYNISTV